MKSMSIINEKTYHTFMVLWIVIIVLIALGSFLGKFRFGHGLGDLVYIFSALGLLLLLGVLISMISLRE